MLREFGVHVGLVSLCVVNIMKLCTAELQLHAVVIVINVVSVTFIGSTDFLDLSRSACKRLYNTVDQSDDFHKAKTLLHELNSSKISAAEKSFATSGSESEESSENSHNSHKLQICALDLPDWLSSKKDEISEVCKIPNHKSELTSSMKKLASSDKPIEIYDNSTCSNTKHSQGWCGLSEDPQLGWCMLSEDPQRGWCELSEEPQGWCEELQELGSFRITSKDSNNSREKDMEVDDGEEGGSDNVSAAPCEWLYLTPYHNLTLSGLWYQVREVYPGGNRSTEASPEIEEPVNQQPGEGRRGFPPCVVLMQGLALLLIQYLMWVVFTYVCVGKIRKKRKTSDKDLRQDERILQEQLEREAATRNVEVEALEDLGSRLQKYWFMDYDNMIFTKAPVPKNCFLDLTLHLDPLNEFIQSKINTLPYIQPIYSIQYQCEGDRKELTIYQPFHKQGSLRDIIHQEVPIKDWSEKYLQDGTPLPPDKVARYGSQILLAMTNLYPLSYGGVSLCPLEHVHMGNIFVEDDTCLLGGFENKLLGYRPRLYRTVLEEGKLPFIDVITFGHVVYEMASGRELKTLTPREEGEVDDYAGMEQSCVEILRYIFTLKHKIKKIKGNNFFAKHKEKSATDKWFKKQNRLSLEEAPSGPNTGSVPETAGRCVMALMFCSIISILLFTFIVANYFLGSSWTKDHTHRTTPPSPDLAF